MIEPNAIEGSDPDWIRQALSTAWHEVVLYLRTLRAISLAPRAFGAGWGRAEAMAPLTFFATSLGLHLAVRQGAMAYLEVPDPGFWKGLLASAAPYLQYVAIGLCVHPTLRWFGSTRRLRSTIAIALYAGGGPAALVKLVFIPIITVLATVFHFKSVGDGVFEVPAGAHHLAWVLGGSVVAAGLTYIVCFSLALAGLHGLRARKTTPVLLVALVLASIALAPIFSLTHAKSRAALNNTGALHVAISD